MKQRIKLAYHILTGKAFGNPLEGIVLDITPAPQQIESIFFIDPPRAKEIEALYLSKLKGDPKPSTMQGLAETLPELNHPNERAFLLVLTGTMIEKTKNPFRSLLGMLGG